MNITQVQIDAIRNMDVPKVNENSEYSDGYSDALDDIVEMLEALAEESKVDSRGDFI